MRTAKRKTIADVLRAKIRDSGLSLNAISQAAGIAQPVLSRFASKQRDLTLRTADKLFRVLGLEVSVTVTTPEGK